MHLSNLLVISTFWCGFHLAYMRHQDSQGLTMLAQGHVKSSWELEQWALNRSIMISQTLNMADASTHAGSKPLTCLFTWQKSPHPVTHAVQPSSVCRLFWTPEDPRLCVGDNLQSPWTLWCCEVSSCGTITLQVTQSVTKCRRIDWHYFLVSSHA
jgi:hypothetical protein